MKVFINNFSLNCALGCNKEEIVKRLFVDKELNETSSYTLVDGQATPVFEVKGDYPKIPDHLQRYNSRNNQLILMTLLELQEDIEALKTKYGADRIGIIFGTSTTGIEEGIKALRSAENNLFPDEFDYAVQEMGSPSEFIKEFFGLNSICYTISTACSSSARSFIEAKSFLENGVCDVVLVGGADALNDLTLNGFHCLEAISSERTNPFSKNRKGINIGEGASLFILSKETASLELLGSGESSDAYHISSPDPSGEGALVAMKMALEDANLSPEKIDYINLHGTGTEKNDEMEAKAVVAVFGDIKPYVSSTKPRVGHTLGAAGGIELAFCALAIENGSLPIHYCNQEYAFSLNYVADCKSFTPSICMSNSYAFGGNNVSLIVGKVEYD